MSKDLRPKSISPRGSDLRRAKYEILPLLGRESDAATFPKANVPTYQHRLNMSNATIRFLGVSRISWAAKGTG